MNKLTIYFIKVTKNYRKDNVSYHIYIYIWQVSKAAYIARYPLKYSQKKNKIFNFCSTRVIKDGEFKFYIHFVIILFFLVFICNNYIIGFLNFKANLLIFFFE